ncbi:MAG: helix-turn-helix domain-containing protein [Actinobacteria bacterium]|nr:helix-turn-helix domain-containing protein [Actinomycetota bacterium]MBU4402498.1 helix-turn-helix domain-containing protein [Actinomycetota bacterium]MCG2820007.1 helix-turn-helix domain-containing protein [Actinomycetes bacterium]
MENWPDELIETASKITWSQWAALGAYITVEPCRKSVVDPEALVVATCVFGRQDARIFDEAMDWIAVNHHLLKPWRLKKISRAFGEDVQRTLGAVLEYISEATGSNLFPRVREEASVALSDSRKEELFWSEKGLFAGRESEADPVFMRWKLLRGKPGLRGHSGTPDQKNPVNLMVRLRGYYGTGTRADVITYLLAGKGGSSNEIASKIKYDQSGVYRVLEELVESGIVQKYGEPGYGYYWLDRDEMAQSLGLEGGRPVYFVWSDIFRAFYLLVSDWMAHKHEYQDRFLSAERMRDLTAKVVPLLRKAGEPLLEIPVPDIGRQKGQEHSERLIVFLDQVMDVLRCFTIE